jgi:calcium-dependent protein kinase
MGIVVDSCKSTINCCDDDEEGYVARNYTRKTSSDNESAEEDFTEHEEKPTEKIEEAPKDISDMVIKANKLFMQRHQSPWKFYEELEEIGSGMYGVVKKVRLISNPEVTRAMKIIPEENVVQGEGASLIDEIEILKNLDHINIMKMYESFVDNNNYYIVSELCDQGHLLSKMEKLGKMDQIVVKYLMDQIFNAVAYLHSKNILHGDIKLENVLLNKTTKRGGRRFTNINLDFNENEELTEDINKNFGKRQTSKKSVNYIKDMMNYEVKLIDFGCSKYFVKRKKKKKLRGIIGTSIYCSPEVVDNLYDERSDEWSCGVLMYILLSGVPPFYGDTEEEIFEKIKKCKYDFTPPPFKKVSKNCKDLIRRLLEPKKQYRIKAIEALRHPFFTESFDPNSAMTEDKDLNVLKNFINPIKYQSKFHEAIAVFLCVNFITTEEENTLKTVFRYLDKDGKGIISLEMMKKSLEEIGIEISDEELQKVFDQIDENGSSFIEYQEFIRNTCDIKKLMSEQNLKNVFNTISSNNNTMTGQDIKNFIFHDAIVREETLKEYFDSFGMKFEDSIVFDDFYNMIRNNQKLGKKEKKQKFEFKGDIIEEKNEEEENGGNIDDVVENGSGKFKIKKEDTNENIIKNE